MKKTGQIVVAQPGGPYRALDLERYMRRTRLEREIRFLVKVAEWKSRAKDVPFAMVIFVLFGAFWYLVQEPSIIRALIVTTCALILLWISRFSLYLFIRYRQSACPLDLLKQKVDELGGWPPE